MPTVSAEGGPRSLEHARAGILSYAYNHLCIFALQDETYEMKHTSTDWEHFKCRLLTPDTENQSIYMDFAGSGYGLRTPGSPVLGYPHGDGLEGVRCLRARPCVASFWNFVL